MKVTQRTAADLSDPAEAVSTQSCVLMKRNVSHKQNKVFALTDTLTFFFRPDTDSRPALYLKRRWAKWGGGLL